MTDAKPMSDAGSETVWMSANAGFVEALGREAQLRDESLEEFISESIRQRLES